MINIGIDEINILFPFNILLDRNLAITSQGSSNNKLFGNLKGEFFYEHFFFIRPKLTISMNFDSISQNLNKIIIVKNKNNELLFRGQFILIEKKYLLFVNSPWVFDVEVLNKNNLLINDFAIHDTVVESIDIIQSKEILNNDLFKLNNELHQNKEQLENAYKELNYLVYILTHDLQEPLRTISNIIEIMNEDCSNKLDDSCTNYLNIIDLASKRLKVLINDVLDSHRLGEVRLKQVVNVETIIKEVLTDLQYLIKSSEAKVFLSSDLPNILCFETEIRQLFQNLISNSIKYAKKNTIPEIRISSERINNFWQFSIEDNGIGIDLKFYKEIFNIFKQVDHQNHGHGIGLASCKKIVENHNGNIWVSSELGLGSTFYFTIQV